MSYASKVFRDCVGIFGFAALITCQIFATYKVCEIEPDIVIMSITYFMISLGLFAYLYYRNWLCVQK